MKAVQPVIASNGVPSIQMRLVVSHSTSGREKEGIQERKRLIQIPDLEKNISS
jgi:hypothetical protein